MDYIVFDLEWNQASDLETKQESALEFEIIEIGAMKLNENREATDHFHELIRPQVFHRMNAVTGELLHLRMEQLENCRTFPQAAGDFLRWCGNDCIFCTWGDMDLFELQKNMEYYHMPPLSEKTIRFYDIQKLFGIAFEDRKSRRTLEYAVGFLGIRKDGAFHRAYADAYYAARIISRIEDPCVFENYSFDTYCLPENKAAEIRVRFGEYSKYITREFADKTEAMSDKDVLSTRCLSCKARTKKKIPWFTNNGRNYYSIAICPNHGAIKGKIRLRRSRKDKIYVVKTMRLAEPDVVEDIVSKKNQTRKKRKESRLKERRPCADYTHG